MSSGSWRAWAGSRAPRIAVLVRRRRDNYHWPSVCSRRLGACSLTIPVLLFTSCLATRSG